MHFPDSYQNIRRYAADYAGQVQELTGGKGIASSNPGDDVFAVLMEKGDVARLLLHPNCHKLAAIIGIADDGDGPKISISLLAVGADGQVLPEHRREAKEMNTEPPLAGEEVWPTKITVSQMETFLPA